MVPDWPAWVGACFVTLVLMAVLYWGVLLHRNLKDEPQLGEPAEGDFRDGVPLVSVVIPAKDEESCVEQSVRSVLALDYPSVEVIVINDRSRDRTGEIIERLAREDLRIRPVTIDVLPQGWTGKTHALYQGALLARGDVLLFTDADTLLGPTSLSRGIRFVQQNDVDMLSLLPWFITRGFSESVVSPHLALGLGTIYQLKDVNDRLKDAGLASGSFIMIKREVYDAVGTWEQFRTEITEDVALSKAVKRQGHRLMVVRGGNLVRTRGFENVSDLCRFWKRTFYGSFERDVFKILKVTSNYVALVMLSVCLVVSATTALGGKGSFAVYATFVISAAATGVLVAMYGFFTRKEFGTWAYGLTAPLGVVVSAWVAMSTLVMTLSGRGIQWRGSCYK